MAQKFIAIALVIIIGLWLGKYFEKKPEKPLVKDSSGVSLLKHGAPASMTESDETKAVAEPQLPVVNKPAEPVSKPTEVQASDLSRIESFFQSGKAPISFADLERRTTPLKLPRTSAKPEEVDTGIAGIYTGYIFESKTQLQRIRISTAVENRVALEGSISVTSGTAMVDYAITGANQKNFGGDPYSFVYKIPDGRIIYVKLFTDVYFTKYSMSLRVMSGWIVDPAMKHILKLALMDDMSVVDQKPWPDQELIEPLLPEKTLRP
ncbi:MAG: hypothetical protein H7326_04075 [Bdellovibrionaceae bacterium]|nr:hypothetical protein [Pseudobdellovibrionaceae bacterium]